MMTKQEQNNQTREQDAKGDIYQKWSLPITPQEQKDNPKIWQWRGNRVITGDRPGRKIRLSPLPGTKKIDEFSKSNVYYEFSSALLLVS